MKGGASLPKNQQTSAEKKLITLGRFKQKKRLQLPQDFAPPESQPAGEAVGQSWEDGWETSGGEGVECGSTNMFY